MKRLRVRRIIFWSLIFFLVLGVIMAVLFPAGSDPFSAHSGSLAAKGRTIYELMKTNEWRRKTEGVWCDPKTYDNSVAFITVLCESLKVDQLWRAKLKDCANSWNIAIAGMDSSELTFPVLISDNLEPRFLEWTVSCDEILPIENKTGGAFSSLGGNGIVVVLANGVVQVIKAKKCTKKMLLGNKSHPKMRDVIYLTPKGKVVVRL